MQLRCTAGQAGMTSGGCFQVSRQVGWLRQSSIPVTNDVMKFIGCCLICFFSVLMSSNERYFELKSDFCAEGQI